MRPSKIITGAMGAGPQAPRLTLEHRYAQGMNIHALVANCRASAAALVRLKTAPLYRPQFFRVALTAL